MYIYIYMYIYMCVCVCVFIDVDIYLYVYVKELLHRLCINFFWGQKFFLITALTFIIRVNGTCRRQFLIEANTGYPMVL